MPGYSAENREMKYLIILLQKWCLRLGEMHAIYRQDELAGKSARNLFMTDWHGVYTRVETEREPVLFHDYYSSIMCRGHLSQKVACDT